MTAEEYHWTFSLLPTIILLTDLALRIAFSIRVIMRKPPYSSTFAWLTMILLFPFFGVLIYLLVGENRIPEKRTARLRRRQAHYQHWLNSLGNRAPVDWSAKSTQSLPLHRQARHLIGIPALAGNSLELFKTPDQILDAIIADIHNSRSTCHLQFYIWNQGGKVDQVERALIKAVRRGVTVRILLDSLGSREFFRSDGVRRLREAGISVRESLPAGFIKALFERIDIRNHRKMVVIDGEVAYTGSQNMIDPRFFKQDQDVGHWIDLMMRITGPVVESLAGTFINDWLLESEELETSPENIEEDVDRIRQLADVHALEETGTIPVQLVPSGPGLVPAAIHDLLLTTIYTADRELVLTTPYFVPDDSVLTALKSAAQRGVEVVLILPGKNDSRLVEYASRAHYQELAESGVRLMLFHGGLLHSKTITVDRKIALFGSVNLDMRSFWLNFEATLFIYDSAFAQELRQIQSDYEEQSIPLDLEHLVRRPMIKRFKENVALLIGPLL